MTITFDKISSSKRTPGTDTEISTKGIQQNPSNRQKLMIVAQRMSSLITTPSFAGGTLNNCTLGTTPLYTGTTVSRYIVEITTAAGTDIFRWSKDKGVTWTNNVNCSTNSISLADGVTITFGAATGHAVGDKWTFTAFPAGSVAQKIPTQVLKSDDAGAYGGLGSIAHRMVKAVMATAELYGSVDTSITLLDDAAGNAATGSLTIAGTATSPGYVRLKTGNDIYEVSYTIGDTAESISLLLHTLLDDKYDLAFTTHRLAGTLGRLVFTAKNKGTLGNDIMFDSECTPNSGITLTLVAMSGGTTDPSNFDDALDSFQSTRYHVITSSFNDATNLASLKTHVAVVSGTGKNTFAIGLFGANSNTLSSVVALARGVNHERLQCKYLKGSLSAAYEIVAAYSALRTFVEDPAMPLDDYILAGINIPPVQSRLTDDEIEICLQNGISPLKVDASEQIAVVRAISTWVNNGIFLDITTILSLDYFRYAFKHRCSIVYKGGNKKNFGVRTSKGLVRQAIFVAHRLEDAEILRNVDDYASQFIAEEDATDPTRQNIAIPSPVVPGLERICARFDLVF